MTNLTGLFKTETDALRDSDQNEKLVDLFRNRSELKKEFAALRDEKFQLKDRIKHHESEAARVQQQMEHLENLLSDREWGHNVVAYYQLRLLSAKCNERLAMFAEQLKQKREARVHGHLLSDWNQQRADQAAAIEASVAEERLEFQRHDDHLKAVRNKLAAMNGFVKLFLRRGLEKEMRKISACCETIRTRENELQVELRSIESTEPPDPEGLDIEAKRKINFMILSFAQQLYLHFEDYGLAAMAKESTERSVGAVMYGSKHECDEIVARITKRLDSMESVTESADILQKRALLIAERAIYKNDDDVIPVSGSVATVYSINSNGVIRDKDVNILGENYFAVANELSC